MKSKSRLQVARIAVSSVIAGLVALSFLDLTASLPTWFHRVATFGQFVPSLLSFLAAPALLASGFLVVMLLTLLFGRIYCSWLCPLGFFQDILIRLHRFFKKKKLRFGYHPAVPWLRYGIVTVTLVAALAGLMIPLMLLDPFSLAGRMMVHLFHPVLAGTNNLLSGWLSTADLYWLKPRTMSGFNPASFISGLVLTIIIGWLSVRSGRLWCNTLCPVGTTLGLVSRFSLWRITLDQSKCTSCGVCSTVCKAQCIDTKARTVDFDRCVGCMNCLTSCSQGGVKYTLLPTTRSTRANRAVETEDRRNTLKNLALLMLAAASTSAKAAADVFSLRKALKTNDRTHFVSPPGSIGIDRFNNHCTACHLCVSACPTRVLQPSLTEYGLKGFLQPYMDYHSNFCNFECTRCGEVCPTGAIKPLTKETKKQVQTGIAQFVKENCVVYTDETACGACSEHCPTKAVNMVEYKPGLLIPQVTGDICVGCGACEYACPTIPNRAIFVDGHLIHQTAAKPQQADESKEEVPEEFPF